MRPHFPPLIHYIDQVQDLLVKYPVGTHDPGKTTAIMERRNWSRDDELDGFQTWSRALYSPYPSPDESQVQRV